MTKVQYELFGDARISERVFRDIVQAIEFREDIFRDGGTARIITIGKN
jgi:hypothetical protein